MTRLTDEEILAIKETWRKLKGSVEYLMADEILELRAVCNSVYQDKVLKACLKVTTEELKEAQADNTRLRERLRENQTAKEDYYEGRIKVLSELCLKPRDEWTDQDRFNHGVCTSGILGG